MHEALSHPDWKHAMVKDMIVLHSSGSWDLVTLLEKHMLDVVGCIH